MLLPLVLLGAGRATDAPSPGIPRSVATGELGPWQDQAPLPIARANHDRAAMIGGNELALVGAGDGPGDTTVLSARVRFPTP